MKPVLHFYDYPTGAKLAQFYCAGCQELHQVAVAGSAELRGPVWEWDKNDIKPTMAPSIRVTGSGRGCHSFIRGGSIQFLSDSTHALAGKTVPLLAVVDWPEAVKPYKLER